MSIRQLTELKRDYVPNSREFGRRAFARRFGCSIGQIDYWLASEGQRELRRKWRRNSRGGRPESPGEQSLP